jgi:predicted acyl esterase
MIRRMINGRTTRALLFETPPLEEPIEILGAAIVTLDLASDKPIANLVVRLCDGAGGAEAIERCRRERPTRSKFSQPAIAWHDFDTERSTHRSAEKNQSGMVGVFS